MSKKRQLRTAGGANDSVNSVDINDEIVQQAANIQNSLRMRGNCEKYFMNACINPVLLNLNKCITHLHHISTNNKFIKFWNKRSDYQRYSSLWSSLQLKYCAYL